MIVSATNFYLGLMSASVMSALIYCMSNVIFDINLIYYFIESDMNEVKLIKLLSFFIHDNYATLLVNNN